MTPPFNLTTCHQQARSFSASDKGETKKHHYFGPEVRSASGKLRLRIRWRAKQATIMGPLNFTFNHAWLLPGYHVCGPIASDIVMVFPTCLDAVQFDERISHMTNFTREPVASNHAIAARTRLHALEAICSNSFSRFTFVRVCLRCLCYSWQWLQRSVPFCETMRILVQNVFMTVSMF